MKPQLALAAAELSAMQNVAFAAVDATLETRVAGQYEIKGYPTIQYFRKGQFMEKYSGARDKQSLVSFIKKKTKDEL